LESVYRFLSQKELDPDFVDFNSVNRRYHFPARAYIPLRANFIQIDPLAIGNPGGKRALYLYAMANPLIRIDPDGRADFGLGLDVFTPGVAWGYVNVRTVILSLFMVSPVLGANPSVFDWQQQGGDVIAVPGGKLNFTADEPLSIYMGANEKSVAVPTRTHTCPIGRLSLDGEVDASLTAGTNVEDIGMGLSLTFPLPPNTPVGWQQLMSENGAAYRRDNMKGATPPWYELTGVSNHSDNSHDSRWSLGWKGLPLKVKFKTTLVSKIAPATVHYTLHWEYIVRKISDNSILETPRYSVQFFASGVCGTGLNGAGPPPIVH
jgi:RHS repeat-associated protein